MNDREIQRRLQRLTVPPPSDAGRDRARHRALLALGAHEAEADLVPKSVAARWAGALAAALALAAVLSWMLSVRFAAPDEDLARDREILRQMEVLFPHQIESVIEENGKVSLSIAQSAQVGGSQPVVVLFRHRGRTIRVLSFSGHTVCLPLQGQDRCFEILATPSGDVLLDGADHAWLASQKPTISGYAVRAQTLEASL